MPIFLVIVNYPTLAITHSHVIFSQPETSYRLLHIS